MVFSSITFIYYFLPAILLLYYIAPNRLKNVVFLLASLFFYTWGELEYVLLIVVSIAVNYYFGISFDKNRLKRKSLLIFACIFNIGLLVFFKYTGFILGSANDLLGLNLYIPLVRLPLGISFFTFQALSYVIDVYREDVPVQTRITDLALYIVAFPQLIAGPIVRYNSVNEQIQTRVHSADKFAEGIKRFLLGLGKKILLANSLAVIADASFNSVSNLTVASAWVGLVAYTFQIYYDFSGYSDMAIGLGKMFGFDYEENFNYPYTSKSISEFWRRWHISLGTWFRDYIYIPLGGSRVSRARGVLNLFIIWFLTGMWHGASWSFILWGLYFGVLIFTEKSYKGFDKLPSFIRIGSTFFLVMLGWVFFRAENQSIEYLKAMLSIGEVELIDVLTRISLHDNLLVILASFALATPFIPRLINSVYSRLNQRSTVLVDTLVYISIFALSTIYLVNSTYNPFIYFRF